MRGQVTLEQRRGHEAARLLIGAARRLEPLNVGLSRETYLQAATIWAGDSEQPGILHEVASAASPRTVEGHLRKVFTKLGITSRRQLREPLPANLHRTLQI